MKTLLRPFPSYPQPLFQNEAKKPLIWKCFFYSLVSEIHFQKKGFALRLVSKVRIIGTQKWTVFNAKQFLCQWCSGTFEWGTLIVHFVFLAGSAMTRPLLQCSLETTWEEPFFMLRLNMVGECINGVYTVGNHLITFITREFCRLS